jgi:biotin operon repressor
MEPERFERLQSKTPETRFLLLLTNEYHFAPKIAEAILQDARACLEGEGTVLKPGQVRFLVAQRRAKGGQALRETPTVEVIWTVDAGNEDLEILKQHGRQALRQARMQRLVEEALAQDGVASQEDLAQALHTSVRTIKREVKALAKQGLPLATRGALHGIGRGQSHKTLIIGRWLQGETYDQIAKHTHHSLSSIQRYIRTFVQVMQLERLAYPSEQIARVLQIGVPLVNTYVQIGQETTQPEAKARLEAQLQRMGQRPTAQKGAL